MSAAPPDDWGSHWADYGTANARNPAQEYRQSLLIELLERFGAPERLLDVGSGTGEFIQLAARRWPAAELLGLELSSSAVEQARAKLPRATFLARDLVDGGGAVEGPSWATHAACSEVLEHVDDPATLLRHARDWMAPGCWLVVTVPGGPMSAFDRHIGHRRHFTKAELGRVVAGAGLEVHGLLAAGFPFFNIYRRVVIARGERLITDATAGAERTPSGLLVRAAMAAFRPLFRLNQTDSRFGWQMACIARQPTR